MTLLTREPVLTVAAIQAALTAAVALGLDLSTDQIAAVVGASGALLALVVRQAVISPATVAASATSPQEVTGLAGALVKQARSEAGAVPVAALLTLAVALLILAGAFVTCDAIMDGDDDEVHLGWVQTSCPAPLWI